MLNNFALTTAPWDRFFNTFPDTTFVSQEQESVTHLENGDTKLELAVPGYSNEDITLSAKSGTLDIQLAREGKKGRTVSYRLGNRIDSTKITAVCKNGLLTVLFPVRESDKPVTIKVG